MKISELISQLVELSTLHGDLECKVYEDILGEFYDPVLNFTSETEYTGEDEDNTSTKIIVIG